MTRILAFIFAAIEVWHARHTRRYNTSHHGAVTTARLMASPITGGGTTLQENLGYGHRNDPAKCPVCRSPSPGGPGQVQPHWTVPIPVEIIIIPADPPPPQDAP